jgi:YD repeat-containing protein
MAANGLSFIRQYNSQNTVVTGTLGTAWHHNYERTLTTGLFINSDQLVYMGRHDGTLYVFTVNGMTYTSQDANITDQLSALLGDRGNLIGWKYTIATDDTTEIYDLTGTLKSIRDRAGMIQTLTYSDLTTSVAVATTAGLLIRVTDAYGHQLNFTYDSSSRIKSMTDPAGGQYLYSYDANNNLASITYPEAKTKTYLYNEAAYTGGTSLPNALTGIIDEKGIRYASYYYNAQGKAYKEQHAGGVDQYQLSYSPDSRSTTITDPLGTARTTTFATVLGAIKSIGQSQPGGAGCGAASSALTYDANGNIQSRTDFNGSVTTYSYDLARNLETSRVEGAGTVQARIVTTSWHATYRLPTAIAEPKRKTLLAYDAAGNLLTKTVQATADATGVQGMSAAAVGVARTWTYTYNNVGQVLTATGPRTDAADVTAYAYDAQGNLSTLTNAAGQATTLSNYDANGRAGRITDPNGLATDLTYSPRGWLTSRNVGGEATSYSYDGAGQLTLVTLPDASTLAYGYDDAHRLTRIADSAGNSVAYTLDAIGNRVSEKVTDPDGVLARETTRVYDTLNRLQQITGGLQ